MLRRIKALSLLLSLAFVLSLLSQGCSSPPVRSNAELYDVTFAKNRFLAVGTERIAEPGTYQALILSSSDGQNWSSAKLTLSQPPTTQQLLVGHVLRGIAYGNGVYLAVGGSHQMWNKSLMLLSKDGTQWTPVDQNFNGHLVDVAYGNGLFVVISDNREAWTSTDGNTWTASPLKFQGDLQGITYGQKTFVLYGSSNHLMSSQDGKSWSNHSLQKVTQARVNFSNNRFFGSTIQNLCQNQGSCNTYSLLHSHQGKKWAILNPSEQPRLVRGFHSHQDKFVVLQPKQIYLATDLNSTETWKPTSSAWREFRALAFGNNTFVTVGYGEIQWSPDGETWNSKKYATTE